MQKAVSHLTTALCPSRPNTFFPPNELEESPVLINYSHQMTKEMTSKFSMEFLAVNTLLYFRCKNWTLVKCQYNVVDKIFFLNQVDLSLNPSSTS